MLTHEVRERIRFRSGQVRKAYRLVAAAVLAFGSLTASSAALAEDLDQVLQFNIDALTLDKALLEFGAQAHVQISFAWDSSIARLRTHELKGHFTSREVLTELLKGTQLRYIVHKRTVEILPQTQPRPSTSLPPSSGNDGRLSDASSEPYRGEGSVADPPAGRAKTKRSSLNEVVVTGSRLRAASKEGPQEVLIYGRAQIDRTGQNSVADFLTTLPSVSVASPPDTTGFLATVRLRGLPVGTTLILLDGRPVETSALAGGSYFDLNNIPLAAVQRIEVDENGSSAVYGSDAIAGVVNIILKGNFDGVAANAKYGWAKDLRVIRSSLALGKQLRRGGISVVGSYEIDGDLLNSHRLLSSSNDYRSYGGPNRNFPTCNPGNVFSVNGTPLPGAQPATAATYAAVTGATASGKPAFSQFSYGSLNECSLLSGFDILPAIRRGSVLLQGHFDIVPTVTLFADVLYTHMTEAARDGYAELFGAPSSQTYKVSAVNPYNPFGKTVGVAELLADLPLSENFRTEFFRPLVGIRGTLKQEWQWELATWESTDWTRTTSPFALPNRSAIQSSLNSPDPAAALNPFVNGPVGSKPLLQSLFANGSQYMTSRDESAQMFIRGPILRLPAGAVQAVFGSDYVRSTLYDNDINNGVDAPSTRATYQRNHSAVFGETRIPLIGPHKNATSGDILALTVSGRHDHYDDFGGATTKQFGVELRPVESLLVRGTYAYAFKAPSLVQLHSAEINAQSFIKDPVTGSTGQVPVLTGGNPRLQALAGHSQTFGVLYSSHVLEGLSVAATQWHVVENNAIQAIGPQVIVNNASLFPGRVIRNSGGNIVEVLDTQVNFGAIDVNGLDYELDYRHVVGQASLSVAANATETLKYRQALVAGSLPIEAASKAEDDGDWAPRWKGNIGVGLNYGHIALYLDGRYVGPYKDYDSIRVIGNFWNFDADVRWSVGDRLGVANRLLGSSYIELGATNLFNRAPQFSNDDSDLYGYDLSQASIVGRTLYISVGVEM